MSEITFLHISDSHFPPLHKDSYSYDITKKSFLNTIKFLYETKGVKIDLIFFTGDLASKGKDYSYVEKFLNDLLEYTGLNERHGKKSKRFLFVVPGNHDIDRDQTKFLQRSLNSIEESNDFFNPDLNNDLKRNHFKRFDTYEKFFNSYFKDTREISENRHWISDIISFNNFKVGIVGFNSAWFSQDNSDQNNLWIGERTCRFVFDELTKGGDLDLIFAIHHHPFDWLHIAERDKIKNLIGIKSDINLFGHIHCPSSESILGHFGHVIRIQAGALFESSNLPRRIWLGKINTYDNSLLLKPFSYDDNVYDRWTIDTSVFPTSSDYSQTFKLKPKEECTNKELRINDDKLNIYLSRLTNMLKKDKLERLINLSLSDKKTFKYKPENLLTRKDPSKLYSIFEIASTYPNKRVAIVGDPGAGKTTLLKFLALEYCSTLKKIPVFVRMGLYHQNIDIKNLLDLREFTKNNIDTLLFNGKLLIIWDGVNESSYDNIDDVFLNLLEFMNEFPQNQYFLSCRSVEFPEWVHSEIEEMHVLPIPPDEIKNQFEVCLGNEKGNKIYDNLFLLQRFNMIRELCQNPLLLGMIISHFNNIDETKYLESVEQISSRANLYKQFIQKFEYHQRKKGPLFSYEQKIPFELSEEILGFVAYTMQNRDLVYVSDDKLQELLIDKESDILNYWKDWWEKNEKPSHFEIYKNFINKPQIKTYEIAEDEPIQYSFLHQSFGEFYTSLYVSNMLKKGLLLLEDLDIYIDGSKRRWEVIIFLAGLIDDVCILTSYLKKKAKRDKNQKLLILASHCFRESLNVNPKEADDICIRMIDAFKYWDIPFDYDLIYCSKQISERLSEGFPKRLEEDIDWFTEKYVHQIVPVELKNVSLDTLIDYLNSEELTLAIDAAHTLGKRNYFSKDIKKKVVRSLLNKLKDSEKDFREHIIIALKELSHPLALEPLLEIINNSSESARARAYALNALGNIGDLAAALPIIQYLKNHNNPYRDSASWSLQYIGKFAKKYDHSLLEIIKESYFECLLTETNDKNGRYTKGNIVYSLAELNAVEYSNKLLKWLDTVDDAYVLEDAINAIGILGGNEAAEKLCKYLTHDDPVVRMKTAEALVRLRYKDVPKVLQNLLHDEYNVVIETANEALEKFNKHLTNGST